MNITKTEVIIQPALPAVTEEKFNIELSRKDAEILMAIMADIGGFNSNDYTQDFPYRLYNELGNSLNGYYGFRTIQICNFDGDLTVQKRR